MIMRRICTALLLWLSLSGVQAQTLNPVSVAGTDFIDASTGEPLIFRGTGVTNTWWGRWIWPLSDTLQARGNEPMIRWEQSIGYLEEYDYQQIEGLGLNCMRYEFSYELFAGDNQYRDRNMDSLQYFLDKMAGIGVYTVLTMSGAPGLDVPIQNYDDKKAPEDRTPSVFENDSLTRIWAETWGWLAEQLSGDSRIAAFELLNEPRLPAESDVSSAAAGAKYVTVYNAIRTEDSLRVMLIPEFNSRELDNAQQSISWDRVWPELPDSLQGVGLVYHFYDSWEFANDGQRTYDEEHLLDLLQAKTNYAKQQNRPLFVTEYGVNYRQVNQGNDSTRLAWYRMVHDYWDSVGTSTTAFTLKARVDPYYNIQEAFIFYGDYMNGASEFSIDQGKIVFTSTQLQQAAEKNGFDSLAQTWFANENGDFRRYSAMGNGPLIQEFKRYFRGLDSVEQLSGVNQTNSGPLSVQTILFDSPGVSNYQNRSTTRQWVLVSNPLGQIRARSVLQPAGMVEFYSPAFLLIRNSP